MSRPTQLVLLFVLALALSRPAQAQGPAKGKRDPIDPAGIARLVAESGGNAQVTVHDATGAARFVRTSPGGKLGLLRQGARAVTDEAKKSRAAEFFSAYGSIFGITSAASELEEARVAKDPQGGTHIVHRQLYQGVPVFAGELRSHFDASDELVAVTGTFVPEIAVNASPTRTAEQAGRTAVARVEADLERTDRLAAVATTLVVFREGLAKGVPGPNHLAWQVEVGNRADVREFVYIDAHTGKFIDQITGTPDGLNRRAYDGLSLPTVPPSYPASPYWVEGDSFPTPSVEANNMLLASKETYDLFWKSFGRDSFDAAGATMDAIFNRGYGCPNASWNGLFISFCAGTTTDDITAHEWGHAYTEYTDNLIYQWQPGALNESYSDIWGETVDRLNGRGLDAPDAARTAGSCSTFTPLPPTVTINAPAAIAGVKNAGTAAFGPIAFALTNDVVLVNDGDGSASDGCQSPFVNAAAVAGKLAIIDRGTCTFVIKVKNAQINGAIGVIIANNQGGTAIVNMGGVDPTILIPSLSVTQNDGTAIKAALGSATVNATLTRGATGTDNSLRWLMGEESAAFGGAIRDMWNPTCYGNAGKVSDAQYTCSTGDGGGVHSNSGVPNHAYALLVDGGTYNGQTIAAIGLTKAAHIYFRAMSVYQGPASDFADHADALEQSCSDLIGANLADLLTGAPSGQVITPSDCAQVARAALAVELRNPPTQCNFQPVLAKDPPALCEAGGFATQLFHDTFDSGGSPAARWSVSFTAATADFTPRQWQVVPDLPDHRAGSAFFGLDFPGGTCAPGGDESGVLHLVSKEIAIPASVTAPRLTFDHWVATEAGWDGGNLKIFDMGSDGCSGTFGWYIDDLMIYQCHKR
jgi:Zn-dependent metalloprotease